MNTTYVRLTFSEQEEISRGLAQGISYAAMGRSLGRSTSTISRHVNISGGRDGYRALDAVIDAKTRRRAPRRRKLDHIPLREYVHAGLAKRWSPAQISQRLRREYPNNMSMQVSPETIYTYIYILPRGELKQELISYLRQKRKLRENRRGKRALATQGQIPEMISIEERPAEVEDRTVPGHWESDLVVGKGHKTAIGTIVERTTRTTILVPLKGNDATNVRRAFAREVKALPKQMRLSMTHDRGGEMAQHRLFTKETKMRVYFAHPHSPWERGTNENTNGLIRQFFPKGTDFSQVTRKELKYVQDLLNGRPRRALGYATPYERFAELLR